MIDSLPPQFIETPECYQLAQIIATSPGAVAVTQAQIWREKARELERRLIAVSAANSLRYRHVGTGVAYVLRDRGVLVESPVGGNQPHVCYRDERDGRAWLCSEAQFDGRFVLIAGRHQGP